MTNSIPAVLRSLRPREWAKNLFVFAPVFFAGHVSELDRLVPVLVAFVGFCGLASAVYVLNDVADRERDRRHPKKRHRPIAAGRISVTRALIVGALLATGAALLGLAVSPMVLLTFLGYAAVNLAYSFWLKNVVIADIACIAFGFVLRVIAGGIAADVRVTPWIMVMTFLLAVFIALTKRRLELVLLPSARHAQRPVLDHYTIPLVDQLIAVVTPVTLVAYLLYTLDEQTVTRFGSHALYATAVFVLLGIFRYLYLVHRQRSAGSPTELVFRDLPLILAVIGWLVTFSAIIYAR